LTETKGHWGLGVKSSSWGFKKGKETKEPGGRTNRGEALHTVLVWSKKGNKNSFSRETKGEEGMHLRDHWGGEKGKKRKKGTPNLEVGSEKKD